jgi:hypothetical protein
MKKVVLLIAGLSLVIGALTFSHAQESGDRAHQKWLEEKYTEATSIKPGMSRAELLKLFMEDGGLQRIPASRYVLKSCQLIQIEVKFDTRYGVNYKPVPDENLKIVEVSKPYLERMAMD